jgi:hypothetical protein
MRILYIPHNQRFDFFHDFLKTAVEQEGWKIGIILPYNQRKSWDDVTSENGLFVYPDFSRPIPGAKFSESELGDAIRSGERAFNLPTNRIKLAAERDIGRAFGRHLFDWPKTQLSKFSAKNDSRSTEVIERVFEFCLKTLDAFQPDLILTGGLNAPEAFVTAVVASSRNIPLLINRPSKIHSSRAFWTTSKLMQNTKAHKLFEEKCTSNAPVSEAAFKFVEDFQAQPSTVDYIQKNWNLGAAGAGVFQSHKVIINRAIEHAAYLYRGRQGIPPKPVFSSLKLNYAKYYRNWRQRSKFSTFEVSELSEMKYIYFPMHKEPELAINFQAPFWHDQLNTIAQISINLPYGYKLLVREHKFNEGRRNSRYLNTLANFPGVTIIDPFDSQFKYLENANLIVTENGSSGWEGLLMKKPVLSLDNSFFSPTGLSYRYNHGKDLGELVLEALGGDKQPNSDSYDDRIGWLIDAEYSTTSPEGPTGYSDSIKIINSYVESFH